MANYCIAIGIDDYLVEDWKLSSCVDDALAFARWALQSRTVAPEHLNLLLAPRQGSPLQGAKSVPCGGGEIGFVRPGRREIYELLHGSLRKMTWNADDRLYFYFAGHGCSHTWLIGKRNEPVIFPADVAELPVDANLLLGFEEVLEPLRAYGPREQFIFLDACRDFVLGGYVSSAGPPAGLYLRPHLQENANAQYILYATAPGGTAVERGGGVFREALIEGLSAHPAVVHRLAGRSDYQLTLARLHSFVRKRVETRVSRMESGNGRRYVQLPECDSDPRCLDPVISNIAEADVASSPVTIRVRPVTRLAQARLHVLYEGNAFNGPHGPPIQRLTRIPLKPRFYDLRATAPGMRSESKQIYVPCEGVVELELQSLDPAGPDPDGDTALPAQAWPSAGAARDLTFWVADRSLPVLVEDPAKGKHYGVGEVRLENAAPGEYRATALIPGLPFEYRSFPFPACGARVQLDLQPTALSDASTVALRQMHIVVGRDLVDPAELLGPQSGFSLTSLLAFAAYATYSAAAQDMLRLRSVGLEPLARDSEQPWLTVLVGLSGDAAGDIGAAAFVSALRASLDDSEYRFEPLPAIPGAAQLLLPCAEGSFSIELAMPHIPPVRFALVGMRGRISTLAIGVDDDLCFSVRQYLFALGEGEHGAGLLEQDLPLLEKAQKYFYAGQAIPPPVVDRLLQTRMTDPLAACLVGYSLVRSGLPELRQRYRGDFRPDDLGRNAHSPLQNMLRDFDLLPDSHVLAGLCDPERREQHFFNALQRGLPVFADGFRAIIEHFGKELDNYPSEFERARRTLAVGAAHSSWLSREPELAVVDGRFERPPVQLQELALQRAAIERQLRACGQVQIVRDDSVTFAGSAFLVGSSLAVTADHVVRSAFDADGKFLDGTQIRFVGGAGVQSEVRGVQRRPQAHTAILLLRTSQDDADVMALAASALPAATKPQPGSLICVAGFAPGLPGASPTLRLWPGFVLATPDGLSFDHDASTVSGSGGSPVLDVATARVVGVHWGGLRESGYKRNRASLLDIDPLVLSQLHLDFAVSLKRSIFASVDPLVAPARLVFEKTPGDAGSLSLPAPPRIHTPKKDIDFGE